MRIFLLFFVLSISFSNLFSQTIIKHKEKVSGVWTLAASPYIIEGEAVIPESEVLIIEKGCIVKFNSAVDVLVTSPYFNMGFFNVKGGLQINGTEEFPVILTRNGNYNNWGGIYFNNSNENNLIEFSKFEYAGKIQLDGASKEYSGAIIAVKTKDLEINNCLFHKNITGIYCEYSDANINNSIFTDNQKAFVVDFYSKPIVDHCDFYENSKLEIEIIRSSATIKNSIIKGKTPFKIANSSNSKINYCFVNNDDFIFDIEQTDSNIIANNPFFLDTDNFNFVLKEKSKCIGKADDKSNIGAIISSKFYHLKNSNIDVQNETVHSENVSPVIKIISPPVSRGFKPVVNTEIIKVIGKAIDDNGIYQIWVNGVKTNCSQTGDFQANIALKEGNNKINVIAIDNSNNSSQKEFVIEQNRSVKKLTENKKIDNTKVGKYYAFIIGEKDYEDPFIDDLFYPVDDAQNFYEILTTKYSFSPENVLFLENPTYEEMIVGFVDLNNRITSNDNLLIFYAGHGYWDDGLGVGYWLPSDAKIDNPARWLSNSTLCNYINGIKARHTLLVADACFSGAIFRTRSVFSDSDLSINKLYELKSRKAITSGVLEEVPDKSVFVEYLIKALNSNENKYLSAQELFSSIRAAILNNSSTTPQYGTIKNTGDEGGDFIFILNQ